MVITVNGEIFSRKAVTQPGRDLDWTACLSLPMEDRMEWDFLLDQMAAKRHIKEEDTLYLQPVMRNGTLISGVLVSEGTLVEPKSTLGDSSSNDHMPVAAEQQGGVEEVTSGSQGDNRMM